MTSPTDGYRDWAALSKAIKSAAQKTVDEGGASHLDAQIVQALFDRFLSRVFAQGEDSRWLLKGGTSILARVSGSRATRDVDLASSAPNLDDAVSDLQRVVAIDLGDHVRFELTGIRTTGFGDNQPGVCTRRVVFTCLDSVIGRKVGDVPVDVVVGPEPVGRPEIVTPVNRLHLPRPVQNHPYRLFPVADQIAEKVWATMATNYPGCRQSTRVKDLVDLVVLVRTQRVDLEELRDALATKRALSTMPAFTAFTVPSDWERTYRTLATATAAAGITDIDQATALVSKVINPALTTSAGTAPAQWHPGRGWVSRGGPRDSSLGEH